MELLLLIATALTLLPTARVGGFVLEGSSSSYAQFRKWYPSWNATIEFEFLTRHPNGVLLYTDDGGYYNFIELKLVDGSLRLRYNLGRGAKVLSVGHDLHDPYGLARVTRRFSERQLWVDLYLLERR